MAKPTDIPTIDDASVTPGAPRSVTTDGFALVVAWCEGDPSRVGQILWLPRGPSEPRLFGRGERRDDDAFERVLLSRHRPGSMTAAPPIEDAHLSRAQLKLTPDATGILVENLGKKSLVGGSGPITSSLLTPGDTLEIKGRMLFVCVERARAIAPLRNMDTKRLHPFGEPDAHGFVGESPIAWALRDQCAFLAARSAHVLVLGESGSGKEVVAQAIHAMSSKSARKIVSRNAATFPAGIIDAELFGNAANYPNSGTPERLGLVGEADGSTLFLDEIGELPEELQTRLLRVLDERGEYQRLGESKRRFATLRFIGATNRPIEALKHDVAARLRLRLTLPGLNDRREDIPLLARHLLRRASANDVGIGERFLAGWDGTTGEPRIGVELMRALVAQRYATHVRELDGLLWRAMSTSTGDVAELTPEVTQELKSAPRPSMKPGAREVSIDDVKAALERAGGVQERAWRDLGLANRYVLKRLIKKFGLGAGEGEGDGEGDE